VASTLPLAGDRLTSRVDRRRRATFR